MSRVILVPKLQTEVTQMSLTTWLKQPGDPVEAGEALAEVMTDKVNIEIETPFAGVVEALLVTEGADVTVGQPIARITGLDNDQAVVQDKES